jgi:hypothetical protein
MWKRFREGQATDDSMTHLHCMLNALGYEHRLRICNNNCLNVALYVHCLSRCYSPMCRMDIILICSAHIVEEQYWSLMLCTPWILCLGNNVDLLFSGTGYWRAMFVPKAGEVAKDWRRVHNEVRPSIHRRLLGWSNQGVWDERYVQHAWYGWVYFWDWRFHGGLILKRTDREGTFWSNLPKNRVQ